ncbi:MAG: DNA polymerase I, partial [Rhodospirillales bacterium]
VTALGTGDAVHVGQQYVLVDIQKARFVQVAATQFDLAGDSSDNVPGVPGIGVKTAAQWIEEYGDLDRQLARAREIKQPKRRQSLIDNSGLARISKDLVTLRDDVEVTTPLDDLVVRDPDLETLIGFLREQDFKSLIKRVESRYGTSQEKPSEAKPEKTEYRLVQDIKDLDRWIGEATIKGVVGVDTETTSLDAIRAGLVGISLCHEPGRACYIPLAHSAPAAQGTLDLGDGSADGPTDSPADGAANAPKQIPMNKALARLKVLLEDPSVLKIGHNIKYDMQVLSSHGIWIAPVDDSMVLSYVLEGGLHGHGLDELAGLHLGHDTIKYKDVTGSGKSRIAFNEVPVEAALDYAAEDADMTCRLHRLLKPRLGAEKVTTVYETLERPLIDVLVRMERRGIKVDAVELKRLSGDFAHRLAGLEKEIHELAGHQFNIASPKQLGEVLFDEMGIKGGKKGKTGAYATGAEVLEGLAAEGFELPARVLDWRQLAKLKSTYSDALVAQINDQTGRVHTSYSMAATSTGRLASSDPNLQNIPIRTEEGRKIRRAFVTDEGSVLLSADYSQIELRLLAHVACIDALKDAFAEGADIHSMTASEVFSIPMDGMDPMVRRRAKAINFGIIYGISAFGLARQLGISKAQAGDYINAYFERFPGILGYMERTREEARVQGFVTTFMGRKCHLRGIKDKNSNVRNFAERAAINAPIQGGAADIIKRAMIRLEPALEEAGLKARMLLQVHDELVFEVPESETEDTKAVVKKVMEAAASLDVPLVVDMGIGCNWDQAH